jgi:hypothetical protein
MEALMVAAIGTTVGSTAMQVKESQDARQQALKAQQAEREIQREQNRRAVVNTLRKARIQRAMAQQSALNTGATGSGQAGAIGSIGSQTASSVGFQGMQQQAATNISQFNKRASAAESRAGAYGALSDLSQKAFTFAQGFQ